MNAATEWRNILKEASKSLLILIILERIFLTRHDSWLEVRPAWSSCSGLCIASQPWCHSIGRRSD
jgi:hypothetical protein